MGPAALVTGPGWEGSGPLEGQWGGVSSLCSEQGLGVGPPPLCPAVTEPELEMCLKQITQDTFLHWCKMEYFVHF